MAWPLIATKKLTHDDYTVAWICALPVEKTAARNMLDELHVPPNQPKHDKNSYTFGCICGHNVVIVCGDTGTAAATTVATRMQATFRNLRFGLLVGIAGGVPDKEDVRLGDVVVSKGDGRYGGVVAHDRGKVTPTGFESRPFLNGVPEELKNAFNDLESRLMDEDNNIVAYLAEATTRNDRFSEFERPTSLVDNLFQNEYTHVNPEDRICAECKQDYIVARCPRDGPLIHFGIVASGNQVIKDGTERAKILAAHPGVLAVEMEAAGLMDVFGCATIRGICDYADSHKNDGWHKYASATAAAIAKKILEGLAKVVPPPAITVSVQSDGKRDKQCDEFSQALRLTNPREDLLKIRKSKGTIVDGTCKWLLGRVEYTDWLRENTPQLLLLTGAPGIGKTMISSFLVGELEIKEPQPPTRILAYYFCDNKDERRNTATAILRGLLWQLLTKRRSLFDHILDYKPEEPFDKPKLERFLLDILENTDGEIYFLVDALDECDRSSREDFLTFLAGPFTRALNGNRNAKIKFLMTSRPGDILDFQGSDVFRCLHIDRRDIDTDLSNFIQSRVNDLSKPGRKNYPPSLKKEVEDTLCKNAGGTFLWASLVLEDLGKEKDETEVRNKLQNLPRNLNEVYDRILSQIDLEHEEKAKFVLRWVVVARRPLSVDELKMAYALGPGKWNGNEIPDEESLNLHGDILKFCKPLVYVDDSGTINLVHQSAKDYLLGNYLLSNYVPSNSRPSSLIMLRLFILSTILSADLHSMQITESSISLVIFLFAASLLAISLPTVKPSEDSPLFYNFIRNILDSLGIITSCNFIIIVIRNFFGALGIITSISRYHVVPEKANLLAFQICWRYLSMKDFDRGTVIIQRSLDNRLLPLFLPDNRCFLQYAAEEWQKHALTASLALATDPVWDSDNSDKMPTLRDALLNRAAESENEAMVRLLVERGADVGARNRDGWTALHMAAHNKNEAVARLLLEKGADVNAEYRRGRTALHLAIINGDEAVVQLLLEKGADVNTKDKYGWTALKMAAGNKNEAVVRLLLEKGADVNAKDKDGRTVLHLAASYENEAVVRLLLEKGANVNAEDENGWTALHAAADDKNEAMVRLLLEKGAGVNTKCGSGRTALCLAASNEAVVQLLLEKGAEVNAKDNDGRTALLTAAGSGNEAVVQLLLEKGADVNTKDKYGWTALKMAAGNKNEAVVRLLLEKGADVNTKYKSGWTALHSAASNENEAAVQLLLEKGADVNAREGEGWTALHLAAGYKNEAVVRLLLEKGADVNMEYKSGQTALHSAASNENEAVVQLLFEKGAEVNAKDEYGRTALHLAASYENEAMVRLLLEKGAEVNAKDNNGRTALRAAAGSENEAVVRLLLEKGADVNTKYGSGRTALHLAAIYENEAVVQLLLEKGADVNAKDEKGWTALHMAADNKSEAVVRLLLEKGAEVNAKDNNGRTALRMAAGKKNEAVVRLLLEKGADVNAKDEDGWTALHTAADNKSEAVVRLLLEKGADVNTKYKSRCTVLHLAAIYENEAVVRLLLEKGADVNARDEDGWTALHMAADGKNEAVVRLLLEKGADVNVKDSNGRTALCTAAGKKNEAVVRLLLEKGADVNAKDEDGWTALHTAADNKSEAVVRLLLEKGADVNTKYKSGRTALHLAASNGNEAVVQLLLEKGADINAKDENGWTALRAAAGNKKGAVVRLLLEKGARR
ncbi:hypothetical protein FGG08_003199 [Glutinoglossum americanum]|uniref:NACHT domain-containing protein n=1 Tax=Glutinoglossum americanum TaxID=1670608 RepID=A0A9P8I3A9_9PEZI|nr:hypothetical protein FGG08_003199 [Glutinoglossum americanum]